MKHFSAILIVSFGAALIVWSCLSQGHAVAFAPWSQGPAVMSHGDPAIKAVLVETAPFTIGRNYRPTQGPEFACGFTVEDLIASKRIILPQSMMKIDDGLNSTAAPRSRSLEDAAAPSKVALPSVIGLVQAGSQSKRLYWYRGAKVEVLDENGQVMPESEFLCHAAISVNAQRHDKQFPQATHSANRLIALFTQGITNTLLPEGFGVPVASDEKLRFIFRALNQTESKSRRIKLRITAYLIKDGDSRKAIAALNTQRGDVGVLLAESASSGNIVDSVGWPACRLSTGTLPPYYLIHCSYNKKPPKTKDGHRLTGFWVIPPGRHTYRTPILDPNFALEGPIRAVASHVHPFCEKVSLIEFRSGQKEKVVFTVHCRTVATTGIRLDHIDYLTAPEGISLRKNARYGFEQTYNNTSLKNMDSMGVIIMFCSDPNFRKPAWAVASTSMPK